VKQSRDALAQGFVFLLETKVLFIELGFLSPQSPKMKHSLLTDDGIN